MLNHKVLDIKNITLEKSLEPAASPTNKNERYWNILNWFVDDFNVCILSFDSQGPRGKYMNMSRPNHEDLI